MHSHTVDPRREPVTSRRRTSPRSDTHALAVHEERRRLARELHDSVAQSLYGITLSASRLLTLLERSETAQAHTIINEVLRLASDSQAELRALLHDLRSDESSPLQGGLTGALAIQGNRPRGPRGMSSSPVFGG